MDGTTTPTGETRGSPNTMTPLYLTAVVKTPNHVFDVDRILSSIAFIPGYVCVNEII